MPRALPDADCVRSLLSPLMADVSISEEAVVTLAEPVANQVREERPGDPDKHREDPQGESGVRHAHAGTPSQLGGEYAGGSEDDRQDPHDDADCDVAG